MAGLLSAICFGKRNLLSHFLDAKIEEVKSVEDLLRGRVGFRSGDAVNSLMCIAEVGKSTFLSQYVTRNLLKRCQDGTIALCKSILPDNPSWQGWVAEYEVLATIREKGKLNVRNDLNQRETWRGRCKQFGTIEDVKKDENDVFWLPSRWNQPCFDFLYKSSGNHLQAANITIAKKHFLILIT